MGFADDRLDVSVGGENGISSEPMKLSDKPVRLIQEVSKYY